MHLGPGPRVVVLVSGSGSNLQALLDAAARPGVRRAVVAVGSDRAGAGALDRAARRRRADLRLPRSATTPTGPRGTWRWPSGRRAHARPGGLGRLHEAGRTGVPRRFGGRCVNTPSGAAAGVPRACTAPRDALAYGVKVTGATLFVVDAGVDTGPIVAQRAVPVLDDDDEDALHERIKVEERAMLVDVVGRMAREGWTVTGRKVTIP